MHELDLNLMQTHFLHCYLRMKFNSGVILSTSKCSIFFTWNALVLYLLVVGIGSAATSPLYQIVRTYSVSSAVPVDQTEIFNAESIFKQSAACGEILMVITVGP